MHDYEGILGIEMIDSWHMLGTQPMLLSQGISFIAYPVLQS